ncbi:MAG: hypothetical protein RR334_02065, partial [Clostridia bacterium]
MKKIIIIRGISGSGKTTFAIKLKSLFAERGEDCEICEADDYFTGTDGQYNFNPNLLSQAHNACYSKFVK